MSSTVSKRNGRSADKLQQTSRLVSLNILSGNHADSNQGDDAERGLDEHRAVADRAGVCFVIELLGAGAGRDQAVEAGAGTAGDSDKQSRKHTADALLPAGKRLQIKRDSAAKAGEHNANDCDKHHRIEQIAAEVVTGLQQDPHGNQ